MSTWSGGGGGRVFDTLPGYHEYIRGYHDYIKLFSTRRDIISTLQDVQHIREIS